MAVEFTWTIDGLECFPEYQGQKNVVNNVFWRCTGKETTDDGTFVDSSYGSQSLSYDGDDTFIVYEQLTKETVLDWVWVYINKDAIEEGISLSISQQMTPAVIRPPLPWNG